MVMQQLPEPAELEAIIPDTFNDATVTASSSEIPTPELGEIYKLHLLFPTFFQVPLLTDDQRKGFIILIIRVSGKPQIIIMLKNRVQLLDMVDWARNVHHVPVEKICVIFFQASVFNGASRGPKGLKMYNKGFFISLVLFFFHLSSVLSMPTLVNKLALEC
jgi:hypothetical protein